MPRPRLRRRVTGIPRATYFKPQGVPLRGLEEIRLTVEGLEALRLADLDGLTAEVAACGMGVSRHTFGRVLAEARKAVAWALVNGAALRIEGGQYQVADAAGTEVGQDDAPLPGGQEAARSREQPWPDRPGKEEAMRQGTQSGQGGGQGRCGQGRGGQGRCGQGRGQGQGPRQSGQGQAAMPANTGVRAIAADLCVCPNCGQTVPHTPGTACVDERCPACGAAMVRS